MHEVELIVNGKRGEHALFWSITTDRRVEIWQRDADSCRRPMSYLARFSDGRQAGGEWRYSALARYCVAWVAAGEPNGERAPGSR